MGTGLLLGVKRPERGAEHPPPSSAEVKERVELYLYSPAGPSWPILGRVLSLPLPVYPPADLHSHFCPSFQLLLACLYPILTLSCLLRLSEMV